METREFVGSALLNLLVPGNGPRDYPFSRRTMPLDVHWLPSGEVQLYRRPRQGTELPVATSGTIINLHVCRSSLGAASYVVATRRPISESSETLILGCVWDSEVIAEHLTTSVVNEALVNVLSLPEITYRAFIGSQSLDGSAPINLGSSYRYGTYM